MTIFNAHFAHIHSLTALILGQDRYLDAVVRSALSKTAVADRCVPYYRFSTTLKGSRRNREYYDEVSSFSSSVVCIRHRSADSLPTFGGLLHIIPTFTPRMLRVLA